MIKVVPSQFYQVFYIKSRKKNEIKIKAMEMFEQIWIKVKLESTDFSVNPLLAEAVFLFS